MIDQKLFDKEFKTDDEERKTIDQQINQIKEQYGDSDATFEQAIKSMFGVDNEKALRNLLSLEYKRSLAVIDHLKGEVSENEVKSYYDEFVSGKITARHILIRPETTSDMSSEEVAEAETKAFEKAKDIISKIDTKEDNFAELAEEYSGDPGSASRGGLLDEFDNNSNMDPSFFHAVKNLKNGAFTKEPVKSEYGYHIILKEKETKKPALKDVEDDIRETLAKEKLGSDNSLYFKSLKQIREDRNIKFQDTQLKKDYNKLMNQLIENASNRSA